jgi:hypothetical protein
MSGERALQLREFCGSRSGDKGDISDVTLFACDPEFFEVIREQITTATVIELLSPFRVSIVDRYELPTLLAIKFVIHDVLGGGAAGSLRADNLGKTMGGTLLRLTVNLPAELARRAPRPRPPAAWREPIGSSVIQRPETE